jgi:hypothetical protein
LWIIAVIVVGSLATVAVLLLSMPFDLALETDFHGRLKYALKWSWSFGLIGRDVKFKRGAPRKPQKTARKKPRQKAGLRKTGIYVRLALDIIRIRGLLGHIIRFIKRICRRIKIKRLESEWELGLGDPDETFYLFMLTEPINRLLNYTVPYPVSIRPSFTEAVLEGYFNCTLRVYPIRFFIPVMQFIFAVPTFRVIMKVISARWRKNW